MCETCNLMALWRKKQKAKKQGVASQKEIVESESESGLGFRTGKHFWKACAQGGARDWMTSSKCPGIHRWQREVAKRPTRDLVPNAKVLRCCHRHTLWGGGIACQWEDGGGTSVGSGVPVCGVASIGVGKPKLLLLMKQCPIRLRTFCKGSKATN